MLQTKSRDPVLGFKLTESMTSREPPAQCQPRKLVSLSLLVIKNPHVQARFRYYQIAIDYHVYLAFKTYFPSKIIFLNSISKQYLHLKCTTVESGYNRKLVVIAFCILDFLHRFCPTTHHDLFVLLSTLLS